MIQADRQKAMISRLATTTRLFVVGSFIFQLAHGWHAQHHVECATQTLCNGKLCANTCIPGTAVVNEWVDSALAYQRNLQKPQILAKSIFPGTHNAAISEAYGYGIEKYVISALQGYDPATMNDSDDLGEGVCQHLSLLDQLEMGNRHLEIDVWWTPVTLNGSNSSSNRLGAGELLVCHSPVPLYPFEEVNRLAALAGLDLDWDPAKLSCLETSRPFTKTLLEVLGWLLDDNDDSSREGEIVVLFMDTKYLPGHATDAVNQAIIDIVGDWLWTPADGNPMNVTLQNFSARGKKLMIEGNGIDWTRGTTTPQQVFYPTFWSDYQFGETAMGEFPDCSINGDRSWWGKTWARSLGAPLALATEGMARCGIPLSASNYANPRDMEAYVWSWARNEPKMSGSANSSELCTSISSNSRWVSRNCTDLLPVACGRHQGNDENWTISFSAIAGSDLANAICPSGYTAIPPRNGYANTRLWAATFGQSLWINAPIIF